MKTTQITFERCCFQCPNCGHLNLAANAMRNSFQCTLCRRHWEAAITLVPRKSGLAPAMACATKSGET